jgi:zinc/manganese transport system ATP-binding protein
MLELSHISYSYNEFMALQNVSISVLPQALTAIIGPNGAGKSTLLKIIANLVTPEKGKLKLSKNVKIAYLPQHSLLDRTFPLTVFDVVTMGLWRDIGIFGGLSKKKTENIFSALDAVGLNDFGSRSLSDLSGGQFQRLLFARMIVQDADLLLLDEPFAAIDEPTVKDLLKLITTWHQQGKTILAVMHNLKLVKSFFPTTILLAKKVISAGKTPDVITQSNLAKISFSEI